MKVAVIDLGTNTCNLLIANIAQQGFEIMHQSKQLVQLGDIEIKTNQLSPAATDRVVTAFCEQQKIIEQYKIKKVRVIATSAIRTASNKIPFLEVISNYSGWIVKIVSGEEEADLIFKGVLLALKEMETPSVILDIGGGSNEIILAHKKEMLWKESQPTGMARVITQFALSNPLKADELQILHKFFKARHSAAFRQCNEKAINTLIGCSGAFDTLADIIDQVNPGEKQRRHQEIKLNDFFTVYHTLLESTREQRLNMKGMDMVRVDLIVPAIVFIGQLIKEAGISKILQTDYALREGVLYDLMESQGAVGFIEKMPSA
jgi:exopolyphosphatase / guanosine-5'-triphosphate,3'-diphosphate pyrophosphatase